MSDSVRDIVLLGVGHTHAHVVREWIAHPLPGVRLTCVTNHDIATYSGMLPGVLAGDYPPQAMTVDLPRLCRLAQVELVKAAVSGLDIAGRRLLFSDRAPLAYDALSIGVGSTPNWHGVDCTDGSHVVSIKPMQTFLGRLDARLRAARPQPTTTPLRVVIVGGGAGGLEIALCLPARLRDTLGHTVPFEMTVVGATPDILTDCTRGTAKRVLRLSEQRGIRLVLGRHVTRVNGPVLTLDAETRLEADVVVWATGAAAPPVLGTLGLPVDARGFLLTGDTLQSIGHPAIFGVGDCGTLIDTPAPKAGVYAVRQGPVLWNNLARYLEGTPLERYIPQASFLRLINAGEGWAVGEWHGVSFEGAWCRRLKDTIDSGFIRRYQV